MGMVLRTLKRDAREREEPAEKKRLPYKLAAYQQDHEGKKFKSSNVVYSFWSASKYVLILSLMLWWLPMFGQMIAGYVGGRRAGGPWKGVLASIIPVVALYGIMTGFSSGFLPSHVMGVAIAPAAIGAALQTNIPLLSPYLHFSTEYIGSFVKGLAGMSPYGINTYVLTVAFAYVGGVLAEQSRREIEYNSGSVTSNTTVLVHDPSGAYAQAPPHNWLSNMGAMLHIPMGTRSAQRASLMSRNKDWANAGEMQYDEDEVVDLDHEKVMPDGDAYYERPYMAQRKHRHHHHAKNHGHPHHMDPWQPQQKRRGAPNYSAKPRFRYQKYESQRYVNNSFRRNKALPKFAVSSDPKSIKRAERMIDAEWGHKKYPSYDDLAGRDEREAPEETEAVAIPRREHHKPTNQWDQI